MGCVEHGNFIYMKPLLILTTIFATTLSLSTRGQETTPVTTNAPAAQDSAAKFQAMLANAELSGRWCLIQNGELGPDKQDKYRIESATKLNGDSWIIKAHVQYGTNDFVAPIPVQVKFAGDTPVIVVDNLTVPGGGTYSARVLFRDNTYSGTWSGGTHGGLLHGIITHPATTNSASVPAASAK
jgi:hypothetical protein